MDQDKDQQEPVKQSFSYRLLEARSDYRDSIIEKGGITAKFTIAEVEAMQTRNKTSKKEIEAQVMIKEAEMVNIEHFHPEVKEMTDEQLAAAYLYKEAKAYVANAKPAIAGIDAAIAENDAMVEQVMATLGFEKSITSDNVNTDEQAPSSGQEG
jgi:hypothetical protein